MWYDKYPGMPPRNSPLESLFTLVYLQRQEAQLLSTRALVQVSMPTHQEAQDPAIKAFQKYCDTMFPFLDRASNQEEEQARAQLREFVKRPARIQLRPVWKAQAEHAKRMASLKRFAVKATNPGAPYRGLETLRQERPPAA
jgi:hypothetical protein